ncbi:Transferase [Arabidopsis suecica]|uniref:Transferase n=1 Tax=Arabidopsis suecica TaxID=45249 RepID=A0A8T1YN22_ARASU|nr:Transferase [Arabidopsis suecica]
MFCNLQSGFSLKKDAESEFEIPEIMAAFRKTKEGVNEMIKESVQSNTTGQGLLSLMAETVSESADIDRYIMTSWCRKPFYEVDFGSGSPVWVGYASHTNYDNMVWVMLIDSKEGDGVEAWINLPEEDMSVFVDDQELLAYAVLNPPVLT